MPHSLFLPLLSIMKNSKRRSLKGMSKKRIVKLEMMTRIMVLKGIAGKSVRNYAYLASSLESLTVKIFKILSTLLERVMRILEIILL